MKLFITGANGTLGTEILKQLSPLGFCQIYGLTRSEHSIQELSKKCTPVIGDIRDRNRMAELTRDVDVIMHLAALKHVDIAEHNKEECILTNLEGTKNIVHAQKANNVNRVVFTSTDKAMYPINTYGFCKALGEKLVLENPNNAVCRYGNVVGSKGSIFQRLPKILEETGTISITDPAMTRFWIRIEDAARFVIGVTFSGNKGLQIPKMKGSNVLRMLKLAAKLKGYNNCTVEQIGMRPGEKLHEDLLEGIRSDSCDQFTDKELEALLEDRSSRLQWKHGEKVPSNIVTLRNRSQRV